MTILLKDITVNSSDLGEVKDIYQNSFPTHQQESIEDMLKKAEQKDTHFYGLYDDTQLCGLTYLVEGDSFVYVAYLAISSKVRSKGYGSKTIQAIKEKYASQMIYLEIETVDVEHTEYPLRRKRQAFYFKNGFVETGYHVIEEGETYDLLCSSKEHSVEEFRSFMTARSSDEKSYEIEPY